MIAERCSLEGGSITLTETALVVMLVVLVIIGAWGMLGTTALDVIENDQKFGTENVYALPTWTP